MKSTVVVFFAIAFCLSTSSLLAAPIYMKIDGVDGESTQVEVRNGKAVFKNKKLKPGTYNVSLVYTGKDAKKAAASAAPGGHVKVFSGRADFKGGVSVAAGDLTGDGNAMKPRVTQAEYGLLLAFANGQSTRSAGGGKVSLQDFHFSLTPRGNDLHASLGKFQLTASQGNTADSFFDVFVEIELE